MSIHLRLPTAPTDSHLVLPSQDSDAELAEVFLVRLISVTFAESFQGNTDVPPSIGGVNTTQVTIDPNDSPQGEFTFTNATYVWLPYFPE